jgi:hypothetical protein
LIFFAISYPAFESYSQLGLDNIPLWVSADVLQDEELASLRAKGVDVSVFNYPLDQDDHVGIEAALETIRDHHPDHTVWVGL